VEGDDLMLAVATASTADVTNDDAESAARDENAEAFPPDPVDLVEEPLVLVEVPSTFG
jgi:hypothetical protein